VVKLLDSQWRPDDRSRAWLKDSNPTTSTATTLTLSLSDASLAAAFRGGTCSEFLLEAVGRRGGRPGGALGSPPAGA